MTWNPPIDISEILFNSQLTLPFGYYQERFVGDYLRLDFINGHPMTIRYPSPETGNLIARRLTDLLEVVSKDESVFYLALRLPNTGPEGRYLNWGRYRYLSVPYLPNNQSQEYLTDGTAATSHYITTPPSAVTLNNFTINPNIPVSLPNLSHPDSDLNTNYPSRIIDMRSNSHRLIFDINPEGKLELRLDDTFIASLQGTELTLNPDLKIKFGYGDQPIPVNEKIPAGSLIPKSPIDLDD